MLHEFLETHRAELIERCRERVARRGTPAPATAVMEFGVPMFLGQVIDILRGARSGAIGVGNAQREVVTRDHVPSALASTAARHGHELLRDGFSIDQVVYEYGDLCQSITELATEKHASMTSREFHVLSRCLDDAIADAVTEFGWQRDQLIAQQSTRAMGERLGFLAHELRNSLDTAILSFAVIKTGKVAVVGSTSAALDRSLLSLRNLIDRALVEVRQAVGVPEPLEHFELLAFIAEVQVSASLEASSRGCEFAIDPVAPGITVCADRALLYSAVSNLLQNAFKFTRPMSRVTLGVVASAGRVLIEVRDQCGGLAPGKAEAIFVSFQQRDADRSGLGLGLSIARQAVEACSGKLGVRNVPGVGCVFTIDLPRVCA